MQNGMVNIHTGIIEWALLQLFNDAEHEDEKKDDQDVEIFSGNEVVSVLDPISLTRIQHPARCIFCTHKTTFDAVTFFKFQVTSMIWNCPICSVRIRGIQVGFSLLNSFSKLMEITCRTCT